jgi:hypothetical protein
VYEMALKSPHPIRIGDVEYSRVLWNAATKQGKQQGTGATTIVTDENGDEVEAGTPTIVRKHSLPHLHNLDNSTGINQQIGQGLLLAQQELVKGKNAKVAVAPPPQTTQQLEVDPQQEPPEWSDFVGAIFYILLGLVAMFAGIYSIFVSK